MAQHVTKKTNFSNGGADRKYGRSKLVNRPVPLGSSKPMSENQVQAVKHLESDASGLKSEGNDSLQSRSCVSLPTVDKIIIERPGRTRPQSMLEASSATTAVNNNRSRNGSSKGQTAESLVSSFRKMHINRSLATRFV